MMAKTQEKQCSLLIIAKTWPRDSHGLYDFETTSMKVSNIDVSTHCIIFRRKNEVKANSVNHTKGTDETDLFNVSFTSGKPILTNRIEYGMLPSEENIVKLQDKLWYVIRSEDLPNAGTNNQTNQNSANTNEIVIINNGSTT
jgi:hypothetical protein